MIPNQNFGETISSGNMVTGEATIEMTPAMFNILSNQIYSDKILAVIRESLCNAKDAQVEVDADEPIEIHLPSRLEPFFHIRDFGPGLTERQVCGYHEPVTRYNRETGEKEEVQEFVPGLYLRYGLSTKTDTNDAIGGLGIGCKSPLAYSDSFIVESYQDGVCKTYSVYKENGKPQVSKLTQTMTTEANGLMVKLAVKQEDFEEFANKTAKFLKFFGYPVEVRGNKHGKDFKKPTAVLETALYSTYESNWSNRGEVAVLMGGVVYSLTESYKQKLSSVVKSDFMLMHFEIGELTVAASREGLSEDPETVKAIEDRIEEIIKTFYEDTIEQVKNAATNFEAFNLLKKYGLITSNGYRHPDPDGYTAIKSIENDIVRDGRTVEGFLNEFQQNFRVIHGRRCKSDNTLRVTNLAFSTQDLVFLECDKKTGYVKVANKYSDDGKKVVLFEGNYERLVLQGYFGTDVPTFKVSEQYPIFFPKEERTKTIKVAASGLFTYYGNEVKTLEEEQEGYYIPFSRDNCQMEGFADLAAPYVNDKSSIGNLIQTLVNGGIFTGDEVFLARKGGMPAIKRTKLKVLTLDIIKDKVRKVTTKADHETVIKWVALPDSPPFSSGKHKMVWEKIKHHYPDLKTNAGLDFSRKQCTMLRELPPAIRSAVIPNYTKEVEKLGNKHLDQVALVKEENAIAFGMSSWDLTDAIIDELVEFAEYKRKQNKLKESGE